MRRNAKEDRRGLQIGGTEDTLARYSKVLPISRIDLTPEQTTATGVRPSSVMSALTSKVSSAPLWTPPIPPVAIIGIPAARAINIVALTVVPPSNLRETMEETSLREHLTVLPLESALDRIFNCCSFNPTWIVPPMMPIVAGTAPWNK